MAQDHVAEMKALPKNHDYFIGIDSDGCVFDTMELKQKECFIPNIVKFFALQSVSKYVREVAEFVNLYSKWRGTNRFPALTKTFELLMERPEVAKRGIDLGDWQPLQEWVNTETKLGNPALEAKVKADPKPVLKLTLDWSLQVNRDVEAMVHGVAPFPGVRECLEKAGPKADMIVVSQTPVEALEREWEEHSLDGMVNFIAGQEMGTKSEHLKYSAGGKYDTSRILMIGDAPGDYKAAKSNEALFFPIMPGAEDASWDRLLNEGLDKFFDGSFSDGYQRELLREFEAALPEQPPWKG